MRKDIKDYLHLYLWRDIVIGWSNEEHPENGTVQQLTPDFYSVMMWDLTHERFHHHKPLLRLLSDMTEEEFKEFSKPKVFASAGGTWYACNREIDPDAFDGDVSQHIIEHINDACDDDPENVIMCDIRSKNISYGWIEFEERYHGFGVKEEAEWVRFLLSKGFDLFGLIEAGLAIDKTTLKQEA